MNRDFSTYDSFFYKNATEELVSENKWIVEQLGLLPIGNQKNILDFGCGSGEWIELFLHYAKRVIACDIDVSAINFCRNKYKNNTKISFCVFDGDNIPLPSSSVDVLCCFWVIQEILECDNLAKIISEFHRVLAPEGMILLIENKYSDIRNLVGKDSLGDLLSNGSDTIRQFPGDSAEEFFKYYHLYLQNHCEEYSIYLEIYKKDDGI